MDAFGRSVMVINVIMVGMILISSMVGRTLNWMDKSLLWILALGSIYSSGSGIYYSSLPDYYATEITFTLLGAYLFLVQVRSAGGKSVVHAGLLGALCGAMAGTKITLLLTGAIMLFPTLVAPPLTPFQFLRRLTVAAAGAILTFLIIVWTYYAFSVQRTFEFFHAWFGFLRHPGNVQPDFWSFLLRFDSGYYYIWILLGIWMGSMALFLICTKVSGASRRWSWGLRAVVLLGGTLQIMGLVHRPSGTTLYEVGLHLLFSAAVCIACVPTDALRKIATLGVALPLCGLCGWTMYKHSPFRGVRILQRDSQTLWEIHRWRLERHLPVIVVIPDNNYAYGGVEEALLKGLSDCPTWEITHGRAMLDRIAPRMSFVRDLTVHPSDCIVLWVEHPTLEPIPSRMPTVRRVLSLPDVRVHEWLFLGSGHTVKAAVIRGAPTSVRPLTVGKNGLPNSVVFLGSINRDVVGESARVEGDGRPDVALRITLAPPQMSELIVHRIELRSCDGTGSDLGGGVWDTSHPGHRAIGVEFEGKIVNLGEKKALGIPLGNGTTLTVFLADGGMTTFHEYFVLRVHLSDGSHYGAVLRLRD